MADAVVSEIEQLLGMHDPWCDHESRWFSEEGHKQVEDPRPQSRADPPGKH